MRRFILVLPALLILEAKILIAQKKAKSNQEISIDSLINEDNTYVFVEKMPEFVGGKDSLKAYLKRAISKIEPNTKKPLKGRILVGFIVTKSGHIYHPWIIEGASKELNEAAIKIASSFPQWQPGKQKGAAMNVKIHLPIDF